MDSDTSVILRGEEMDTRNAMEAIMEIIGEVLEEYGIPYGRTVELKDKVERLISSVESYIEDYEEYPKDPYLYNGVSRSDFM